MNRQQKRNLHRTINKKGGQLMAIHDEMSQQVHPRKAAQNRKNLFRLQDELMQMGAIRRPNIFQKIIGSLKATFSR